MLCGAASGDSSCHTAGWQEHADTIRILETGSHRVSGLLQTTGFGWQLCRGIATLSARLVSQRRSSRTGTRGRSGGVSWLTGRVQTGWARSTRGVSSAVRPWACSCRQSSCGLRYEHQKGLVSVLPDPYTDRRRRGRVVEGTPLLRVQTGNRLEGSNPFVSATCPLESVLSIRLRPDFSVVFEGYAGGAEH